MAKPNPKDLPAPSVWATWCRARGKDKEFQVHADLGKARNALGALSAYSHGPRRPNPRGYSYETALPDTVYLFKWHGTEWREEFVLKKGSFASDHPLWQVKKPKGKAKPVEQDELDEALESIRKAFETVDVIRDAYEAAFSE